MDPDASAFPPPTFSSGGAVRNRGATVGRAGEAGRSPGRRWARGLPLLLVLFLLSGGPAFAQEPMPSDDEVNAVAKGLYCPVCENVPLDVCPTQACEQWRATIREKLALGWGEDQIKEYFVAQYGDRVLATPPPRGFNWAVYVFPPLAFAAAVVLLWRTMRGWQRSAAEPAPEAPASDDPYVQRIEEELRRRG